VTALSEHARPALARGVRLRLDRISGKALLLRPEQGFELVGSALAIIRLCDGQRSIAQIVDALAVEASGTPRTEIAADVHRLLSDLQRRGVVAVEEGAS